MIWNMAPTVWFGLGMAVAVAGALWGPDEGPDVFPAGAGRIRFAIIAALVVLAFVVAWPLFVRATGRSVRDRWVGQVSR